MPLPDQNPILEGVRWKQYHYAMGETLKDIPDIRYDFSQDTLEKMATNRSSWKYVKQEKSEDMIHVLQFPYNGEPPRVPFTFVKKSINAH